MPRTGLRPAITTFAPAAASRVATALPIPVAPPVITATFPVKASAMRASSVLARTIRNHCASWTKRCANSHSSSGPHDGPPASFRGKFLDEDVLVLQRGSVDLPTGHCACRRGAAGRAGRGPASRGSVAPGMTTLPLSTILTVLPRTVISNRFHWPTGLSACIRGVTAARAARAAVLGSVRMPYISPEPMGQHQMLTW